jgi:preprotein translocase subunit SecE
MNKLTQYLKEVRVELGKVNWPTRQQTTRYTLVIIGVSVALAIFLGGLDYVFSWILNRFIL